MIAVLGGLGAAVCWATGTLCSSRATRLIGAPSMVAWQMLLSFVIVAPLAVAGGTPPGLDGHDIVWLAIAGVGSVVGLLLVFAALGIGKVSIVAPIASTEGAIAATCLGDPPGPGRRSGGSALPLAATRHLRLTRPALPLVVVASLTEVGGLALYAVGARDSIAISAVLASQFAALTAVAAYVLFAERITRLQVVGITAIAIGVAALTALQA